MLMPIVAAGLLVILAFQLWLLRQVHFQQQRVDGRIIELSAQLTSGRKPAGATAVQAGERAPAFTLPVLGGGSASLASLLRPARPLLLVFVDTRCGPCYELLPDIGGWQRVYGDQLTIALISTGDPHTNQAMTAEYGIAPVLIQRELELATAFALRQAPSAVLINLEGVLPGEAGYGWSETRKLVADTLVILLPEPPVEKPPVAVVGAPAPALRRPDLEGRLIDLSALRGMPLALFFWNPGCHHCQALLPELLAFEQRRDRPRLLVVSRGPAEMNKQLGFRSPIVSDDDREIARMFDVKGTPSAVLIDQFGIVATPVARGETGVRGLISFLIPAPAFAD